MCVVDIDTGAALRLPLSVGPATHYQPLTGQATPSATHSRFPHTHKVRFPALLEFRFVQGGGIWISQGGIWDLPPPRGVGWSVSNLLGGNPGGQEREGEISSTHDEQRWFLASVHKPQHQSSGQSVKQNKFRKFCLIVLILDIERCLDWLIEQIEEEFAENKLGAQIWCLRRRIFGGQSGNGIQPTRNLGQNLGQAKTDRISGSSSAEAQVGLCA